MVSHKKGPQWFVGVFVVALVLIVFWQFSGVRRTESDGSKDQREASQVSSESSNKSKEESLSTGLLRVPSSEDRTRVGTAVPTSIPRSQAGTTASGEKQFHKLIKSRAIASFKGNPKQKLRDLGLKGRGLSRFKLIEGTRAVKGDEAKLGDGFEVTQSQGPYKIVHAKTPEALNLWSGAFAQKKEKDSLPILIHERDKRMYIVTGILKIRLQEFDEAVMTALLDEYELQKIGVVEGIAFIETSVKDGADVFAIFQKLQSDSRVIMVDLDFYQAPPRLK